jgi:hypothetical protein
MFLLVVAVIVVGVLAMMIWNPFARNLSREDFSRCILDLLITSKNGGIIRFDDNHSGIWFSFSRASGSDTSATLALRIPRIERTESMVDDLRQVYESHGYEFIDEVDNQSLLAQVLIPVHDIWDSACGAKGAHAARLLLDATGIRSNASFRLSDFRDPSKRWKNHKDKLERIA